MSLFLLRRLAFFLQLLLDFLVFIPFLKCGKKPHARSRAVALVKKLSFEVALLYVFSKVGWQPRQNDAGKWAENYLLAVFCGGRLDTLVHREYAVLVVVGAVLRAGGQVGRLAEAAKDRVSN